MQQISDTAGMSLVNGYDTAGRLTSTGRVVPGWSGTQVVGYGYDKASNRTQITWPDGYHVDYAYDGLNRMQTAMENGTFQLALYGYDPLSRRVSLAYAGSGAAVAYGYSPAGDLTSLSHNLAGLTDDVSFTLG